MATTKENNKHENFPLNIKQLKKSFFLYFFFHSRSETDVLKYESTLSFSPCKRKSFVGCAFDRALFFLYHREHFDDSLNLLR